MGARHGESVRRRTGSEERAGSLERGAEESER
jgi:hypothetical protein